MRHAPRALARGLPALLAISLAACGSSSGLLSSQDAASLNAELHRVKTALSQGDCATAQAHVRALKSQIARLPSSVNTTVRNSLEQGARTVERLVTRDCPAPQTSTEAQTTPTPTTTATTGTTTTTTTATTTTTPPPTTTTTTTTTTQKPKPKPKTTPATTPTQTGTTTGPAGPPSGPGQGKGKGGGTGTGGGDPSTTPTTPTTP